MPCTSILHSQDGSISCLRRRQTPKLTGRRELSHWAAGFLRSHGRYLGLIYPSPSRQDDASAHQDGVTDKLEEETSPCSPSLVLTCLRARRRVGRTGRNEAAERPTLPRGYDAHGSAHTRSAPGVAVGRKQSLRAAATWDRGPYAVGLLTGCLTGLSNSPRGGPRAVSMLQANYDFSSPQLFPGDLP